MASSTTDATTMHDPPETQQTTTTNRSIDNDQLFNQSVHTGLTALLSAVSLHISKGEDAREDEKPKNSEHGVGEKDSHENTMGKQQNSTTPTMVPESHEVPNHSFPVLLMTILLNPDNGDISTFLPDGKYFVIKKDDFAATLMKQKLKIDDYDLFLDELSRWGFSPIATRSPTIAVYKHRLFRKGDWTRCAQMTKGDPEPRTDLRPPSATPSRTSSMSEDELLLDKSNSSESAKRRLSPTSSAKVNHGSSSKIRLGNSSSNSNSNIHNTHSDDDSTQASCVLDPMQKAADDRRSLALSMTTEKLNIQESDNDQGSTLVQQAVISATHSIVTDAIEALLRDEDHTRKTFKKHEDELSKSSLPGLIPISKQLFSVGENTAAIGTSYASRTPSTTTTTVAAAATTTATSSFTAATALPLLSSSTTKTTKVTATPVIHGNEIAAGGTSVKEIDNDDKIKFSS